MAPMEPRVAYEDERLLAVDKPAGRPVIPMRGEGPEPLAAAVSRHVGGKVWVVHRIDRETSGLVLFAKDAGAHRVLSGLFETRVMEKAYLAAVLGAVGSGGSIEKPLRAFGSGRMGIAEEGKPSRTDFRPLESLKGATLLEVSPRTGRRHQIRVHLCDSGHPVLGDPLYGKERPVGGIPRLMLHAWKLSFSHPELGERAFAAEPPDDFRDVLLRLRA